MTTLQGRQASINRSCRPYAVQRRAESPRIPAFRAAGALRPALRDLRPPHGLSGRSTRVGTDRRLPTRHRPEGAAMIAMKRWHVEVFLGERDRQAYADAGQHTELGDHLPGVGRARPNPNDHDVPEIGDEVAVAGVLSDLGHRLLLTAAQDIEQVTNEPVRLTHRGIRHDDDEEPVAGGSRCHRSTGTTCAGCRSCGRVSRSRSAARPTRTSWARSCPGWIRPWGRTRHQPPRPAAAAHPRPARGRDPVAVPLRLLGFALSRCPAVRATKRSPRRTPTQSWRSGYRCRSGQRSPRSPSPRPRTRRADGAPAAAAASARGALRARGYTVAGPTIRDGAIVLAELACADE